MSKKILFSGFVVLFFITLALSSISLSQSSKKAVSKGTATGDVKRGNYLVAFGGCNDCHSPKIMTTDGPIPDSTRLLSGHPAQDNPPAIPPNVLDPNGWAGMGNKDFTAWAGPWGISYAANLTPDNATGIGAWTEEAFIKAMRTGKHLGMGRPILPPMPWYGLAALNDEDLKAVFAYLKSLPPVSNEVPMPTPPAGK
jgi:mono/diheme cytochrome c family protein